jgi:hypothetical protein
MSLGSSFWPLFWSLVGGGAAVTVFVALAVTGFRRPRQHDQQSLARIADAARYAEASGGHARAA